MKSNPVGNAKDSTSQQSRSLPQPMAAVSMASCSSVNPSVESPACQLRFHLPVAAVSSLMRFLKQSEKIKADSLSLMLSIAIPLATGQASTQRLGIVVTSFSESSDSFGQGLWFVSDGTLPMPLLAESYPKFVEEFSKLEINVLIEALQHIVLTIHPITTTTTKKGQENGKKT